MGHGKSGRIVIDLDPKLKREFYSALCLSGSTLKDWFVKAASEYCMNEPDSRQLSFANDSLVSRKIKELPRPIKLTKKLKIVSMFSGCGGMDLGFLGGFEVYGRKYPRLPYEIIWANDFNEAACRSYKRNLRHNILCGDVWDVIDTLPKSTDILIGGFPCQDISVNGKRQGIDGARSGLYRAMVDAIRKTRPKVFVAENVKGLLMKYNQKSLERVLSDFKRLGYSIHFQLYKAADFGVAQTRERVLFIGTAKGVRPFIPPQPERNAATWITAEEAVSDLEGLGADPEFNHVWSFANVSPEQGNRKLTANRPAHTIRAECHGNIQFHYRLKRRISMREAARFQSFPDNFIFDSKLRETERQVGNAVPPVLAWHIANSILYCFSKNLRVIHGDGKARQTVSNPEQDHRPAVANL